MKLTQAQEHAVTTDSKEVLCLAGAGSGKTRVLVERVVHLLRNCGLAPSELMVLTFTRKAAGEVRERLRSRLEEFWGPQTAASLRPMLLGTFHAVSLHIVRSHRDLLGYQGELSIISDDDSVRLLGQVVSDLGYRVGETYRLGLSFDQVSRAIGQYYSSGHFPVFCEKKQAEACQRIMAEYHSRLRELNALDFGLILLEAKRLLDNFPGQRQQWNERIKAVLVDEVQDTDEIQFDLHDRFCPPATFFGVGDFRQSIYGFRGARPDLATSRHPNAEMIDLPENFRSGSAIVGAANALIHHNGDMRAAPMVCATDRKGKVQVFNGRSDDVARTLNVILTRFKPAEVAVIARSHRTLRRLETVCRDAGLPVYRVGAAFGICESEVFMELIAAMRIAVNRRDNLAFAMLREDFGLTPKQYAELRTRAAEKGCSHAQAFKSATNPLWRLIERTVEYRGISLFAYEFCGIVDIQPDNIVAFWEKFCRGMTLAQALRWYSLRDSQDDLDAGENITLLTAHAAKGLEWPVVLVAELNEKQFPSNQSLKSVDGDKEERRLAYVAMTRARESLILHYREPQDQHGPKFDAVSRFIAEAMGGVSRGNEDDKGV